MEPQPWRRQYRQSFPPECDNLGLVYSRYIYIGENQKAWQQRLSAFVGHANSKLLSPPLQSLMGALDERLTDLVRAFPLPLFVKAATMWRLAIGMSNAKLGDASGFQFHPLYGIPYLPAQAIRGALRHYVEEFHPPEHKDVERLFGPDRVTDQTPAQPAALTFFDAFPLPTPASSRQDYLAMDIVNPHYQEYYTAEGAEADLPPPAEYWDPIPSVFFTFAPDVSFRIAIGAGNQEDGKKIRQWIGEALPQWGLGAKTRKGYGSLRIEEVTCPVA